MRARLERKPWMETSHPSCSNVMRNLQVTPTYFVVLLFAVDLLYCAAPRTRAQTPQHRASQSAASTGTNWGQIARGKYIVEGLAACGDCHTPRNTDGDIDRTKWLAGAPVFYEPAQRVPGWAISAPRIAGVPPGRDQEIITLLTTATWRDGKAPRPPMPHFHMERKDAEAVVAYLKSL